MPRLAIYVIVTLFALAAPMRAWCEASCALPSQADAGSSHCPDHEPTPQGTSMGAAGAANECPTEDAARQVNPARAFAPELRLVSFDLPDLAPPAGRTTIPSRDARPPRASLFERATPLRI